MKGTAVNSFDQFVKLQDEDSWDNYRYSGKITAGCLTMLTDLIKNHTEKMLTELDSIAEEYFLDHNTIPVFKNYHGFPASVCMSINKQLVHGIPKDRRLLPGDIISLDTGNTYKGSITDSAITIGYGGIVKDDENLIEATKKCLHLAIKSVKIGEQIGVIGETIYHSARKNGYKVIEEFTGHGISIDQVHSDPHIFNRDEKNKGVRIQNGMVLAIEPLLISNTQSTKTRKDQDGWTINAEANCSHFEHSILVTNQGVEVLTRRDDENII